MVLWLLLLAGGFNLGAFVPPGDVVYWNEFSQWVAPSIIGFGMVRVRVRVRV